MKYGRYGARWTTERLTLLTRIDIITIPCQPFLIDYHSS
ncbi:Protein of unknown function [Pyronema omphalodes CBS 100304]|uniref:Uncharacterized protein n=1 Tax=Pyronema omphalodes (strain CBS 100304) TaxID=1076935 RepID=U4L3P5_PYROM|nr:Protein of unknown function [Pyronema omphalodes CBS 100304]